MKRAGIRPILLWAIPLILKGTGCISQCQGESGGRELIQAAAAQPVGQASGPLDAHGDLGKCAHPVEPEKAKGEALLGSLIYPAPQTLLP